MKIKLVLILCIFAFGRAKSQSTGPVLGLHENVVAYYAFTNCTLISYPGQEISNGTLIIKNGQIEAAGKNLPIPSGAINRDMKGARIYPAFIEPWYVFENPIQGSEKKSDGRQMPQYTSNKLGAWSWNQAIKPENNVSSFFKPIDDKCEAMRKVGFAVLHLVPNEGIMRGNSMLIVCDKSRVFSPHISQVWSFEKGNSQQAYPSSQMGSIALIRQTILDANWYATANQAFQSGIRSEKVETNLSLEALANSLKEKRPIFFEVKDKLELSRAQTLAQEFGISFIYKSVGDEYESPDFISTQPKIISQLNFPKAVAIKGPAESREVSMDYLKGWIQAPGNPAFLEKNKIEFAFTLQGLEKPEDLFSAIRKAKAYGLSDSAALAALTICPAKHLGQEHLLGSLEKGKRANFLICSDSIFSPENLILETWVEGKKYIHQILPEKDLRGEWKSSILENEMRLSIKGKWAKPEAEIQMLPDTQKLKASLSYGPEGIIFDWKKKDKESTLTWRFSGVSSDSLIIGYIQNPDGKRQSQTWVKTRDFIEKKDSNTTVQKPAWIPPITFPNAAYGNEKLPVPENVLIKGATLWTNSEKGNLEETDILISGGKIKEIGSKLKASEGTKIVEAKGWHLSPGLIDEHSHIAISKGVNEGSHSITSEVRIGDVIDPEDINIYRQLSGGVTTSHLLHGSANPIGGQTALIKLRWGMNAAQMKFEQADPFIKFALGENVKQSNWGDVFSERYPQTRMGVEQIMRDAFQNALDYRAAINRGESIPKDLRNEALLEILDKKRFITCHSYVQSEIVMLMRLAESFGFRVNTFTHILEGYKVAQQLKLHNAFASTFSDWWAYKYEVIDAIPHNASLLTEKGVPVCINSDDAEMGRRLNQEAAKAIKYGGMTEIEALKMVTLNPAKALHIDHRVGSLKVGMDADLVLWSGNPLSVDSKAMITWVDGKRFFDREADSKMQEMLLTEKAKLIQLMVNSQEPDKGPVPSQEKKLYHCETLEDDQHE